MHFINLLGEAVRYPFRPRVNNPIIVAGLGRCGTTMLHTAIGRTTRNERQFVTALDDCTDFGNRVIKTHDYPATQPLPHNARVIFMFGDVVHTVISTTRMINGWGREHFKHLRTSDSYRPYEDLYFRDELQLERLFDAWYRPQPFRLLTLRYESLPRVATRRALAAFLGFTPRLPPFRRRKSLSADTPLAAAARKTYADLIRKLEEAEDFRIWPSTASATSPIGGVGHFASRGLR